MPTIANPVLEESTKTNIKHHAKLDLIDTNVHYPKGFRSAENGTVLTKDESNNLRFDNLALLPACLNLTSSIASVGAVYTETVYLLDNSSATYTISSILWQSGTTVRYSFSGSPDLSAITTSFVLFVSGADNDLHNGSFVITTVSDASDYIEVTNTSITDASIDQAGANGTCQAPHGDWNGATNGDWVRYSPVDSVWYKITPNTGQSCYDLGTGMLRTYAGGKWLGSYEVLQLAVSDETTALTTGTAKVTFRVPFKMFVSSVRASLTTAGTTSGTTTIDVNVTGGGSLLSTKLTIDATETTSTTAATTHVIDSTYSTLVDDSEITIDIDAISGGATEAGLKVTLIGFRL